MITFLVIITILIVIVFSVFSIYCILLYSFRKTKNLIIRNFYRPWSEQGFDDPIINRVPTEEEINSPYPQQYALFLDFIFPYTLFLISFWPILLKASLTVQIFLLATNYLLLLVPFIIFWCKLRNWEALEVIHTFSNPMALKYIITGIIYPSFYIIFIGCLRYLSMGREYIPNFNVISLNNLIYILFMLPHILLVLFLFAKTYTKFRLFFVKEFKLCFHSLHIYFLRSKKYWHVCRNISKYDFACGHLFSVYSHLNGPWKKKYPFIVKILGYIWSTNPKITYTLIPMFFIIEFFVNGKIYYWFFFLFMFFCIRGLLIIFRNLTNDIKNIYFDRYLEGDCHLSNYYSGKTPYYPKSFAICMKYEFGGKYVSSERLQRVKELADAIPALPFTRYYERTGKHFNTVLNTSKLPMFRKIKLYYQNSHGEKWIHTSSYNLKSSSTIISRRFVHTGSPTPKTYHHILPYLLQDIFSRLTMVAEAHNWSVLYPTIQQAERLYPSSLPIKDLYSSEVPQDIVQYKPISTTIVSQTEFNVLTALSCLVNNGMEVGPHKPSNSYANSLKQTNPDVYFKILHKKQPLLIGMDLKAINIENIGTGSNYILSLTKDQYTVLLEEFIKKYRKFLSPEAINFINDLGKMDGIEERLLFYRENMHHFVHLGKFPPINMEKMVSERYFSLEYQEISFEHKIKMGLLSDYVLKQEPLKGSSLRQQTLKLINDPNVIEIKKDISDMLP